MTGRAKDPGSQPRMTWLLRHRGPLLLFFLAASLGFAAQVPSLRFDFSPQELFETGDEDPAWRVWQETIARFGRDDLTLFVVLDAGAGGDVLSKPLRTYLGEVADVLARRIGPWPSSFPGPTRPAAASANIRHPTRTKAGYNLVEIA